MRESRSQFIQSLLIALISAIITISGNSLFGYLMGIFTKSLDPIFVSQITSIILVIFIIFLSLIFIIIFILALKMGSQSFPPTDINFPKDIKFTWWQKLLGMPVMWSQIRNSFLSAILMSLTLIILTRNSIPLLYLGILIFFIFLDSIREFYLSTGVMRRSLDQAIGQMIFSLGKQMELMMYEAYGHNNFRVRICLRLRHEQYLFARYSYNMSGDTDDFMEIGVYQGVEGKVFNNLRPMCQHPYKPEELGFSEEQLKKIPKNTKWKMAFPILPNDKSIGVLVMDSDTDLSKEWLDKMLDFTHGVTSGLGIVISQFPSKILQESFPIHNNSVK